MLLFLFVVGCLYVIGCVQFVLFRFCTFSTHTNENAFSPMASFSEHNLIKLLCNGLEIYQAEVPSLEA